MPSTRKLKITALAGGVGASKLLLGLYQVMDPSLLTIIVNTGDDIVLHGLKISPDLDIITYTLAGIVDTAKGWGFRGETFHALKRLARYGRPDWSDRKSTRLNSSHLGISYAVFCLKKKKGFSTLSMHITLETYVPGLGAG